MLGLNFYVEPIKQDNYWVGIEMKLPSKTYIIPDATAVIIEDAVVREQVIDIQNDQDKRDQVKILLHVYTKQSKLQGYIKTVVCEQACKPEKIAFELDLSKTTHFHHKHWSSSSISTLWSIFTFILIILGGIFLIGLAVFLITMGVMFGIYLFALIAGLYIAVFFLLAMAGAVRNIYEFCAHYLKHECCFNLAKKSPSSEKENI